MLTGAHIWAHIMRGANVEPGACFVFGRRHALGRPQRFTRRAWFRVQSGYERRLYHKAYSCELVRLEPSDHSVPQIEPGSHLLYPKQPGQYVREDNGWLQSTGDITIDGSTSPIRSGAACQVRAGEKHSPRNLDDDSPFCLSTIRHASERRIKTLAALPGGNPAPQKPHRADHGLPRQGARRRGHSARPTTCSAMRAQGNLGFRLS
jgi:hypothetical protein